MDAYGILLGSLPSELTSLLRIPNQEDCIAIVLKYESGGSLQALLNQKLKIRQAIPMLEKLR